MCQPDRPNARYLVTVGPPWHLIAPDRSRTPYNGRVGLSPGTRVAQYEIVDLIGAGGMGEVYRARDSRLDRDVALKVLPEHLAGDPVMRSRFEREARAIALLSHPNILAIHELAFIDDRPVAVVELLEGESLRVRLSRGPMAWRDVVQVGARIADGLAAAHAKGIVHRDLKPENVILTADQRPKILDFGLARSTSPAKVTSHGESAPTVAVTEPGRILGTVGYMSPEQVRGGPVGPPTDIFSLGCTLVEMLTGHQPFTRSTPAESLAAVLHETPAPLVPGESGAPDGLRAVVEHCLEKAPEDRFQSGSDVATALRALLLESTGSHPESGRTRSRKQRTRGLAVLPFTQTGRDPDAEYLGDGLTESVINSLSQLPKLRVVPRSTVFRYKERDLDVRSLGLSLNVELLVTGRVTQQGHELNVQVELVDVPTESQVWGEQFRCPISELLAVQEQIAWQISEALRIRLTGEQKKRLRARPTRDDEAYREYLRGRHAWAQWTPEGFKRAIGHFERAISRDPAYALAYSGLSDTLGAMSYYGFVPPAIGMPRSEAAARRALELDDKLAEAHTTAGQARLFFHRDWTGAEAAFKRAIALNPRHAPAHTFYALLLMALGRFDEATAAATRGRDLDPLSPVMQMGLIWIAYFARRYGEVVDATRELILVSPNFAEAATVLLLAYERLGQLDRAVEALRSAAKCFKLPDTGVARLQRALDEGGPRAYWRMRLELLTEVAASDYVTPFAFASVHTQVGNLDAAFEALDRLLEERAGQAVFLGIDPALDPLRQDARFERLLRRVGLPESVTAP